MLKLVQLGFMALVLLLQAVPVSAQAISPAMLEQFKQLPRAEQERLAKQYGYDLSLLNGQSNATTSKTQVEVEPLTPRQIEPQTDRAHETSEKKDNAPKRFGMKLFDEKIRHYVCHTKHHRY